MMSSASVDKKYSEFTKFLDDCRKGKAATFTDTESNQTIYSSLAVEALKQELKQSLEAQLEEDYETITVQGGIHAVHEQVIPRGKVHKAIEIVFQDKGDNRE